VDGPDRLATIMAALGQIGRTIRVVFPVHPRTKAQLNAHGVTQPASVTLLGPQGYLPFLALQAHARVVVTDSGGVQEETTCLDVPCLTLRPSTERPVTITEGTNRLLGDDPGALVPAVASVLDGWKPSRRKPHLWDGHAGERIARLLALPR